jgi:hypothetical protein
MRTFVKLLATGAGIAALAAAAPASGQYNPYSYAQPYGYSQPYAYGSQYGYAAPAYMSTSVATQQCTAAVQSRLYNRSGISGILGAVLGVNTASNARVVAVTQISPRSYGMVRVRGLASSGRYAYNNYSPYGMGAYGALGYNSAAQADLSFKCDVDYRGYVHHVDINRRY